MRFTKYASRVSVVLTIATLGIWTLSVFVAFDYWDIFDNRLIGCGFKNGTTYIVSISNMRQDPQPAIEWRWSQYMWSLGLSWPAYDESSFMGPRLYRSIELPFWLITFVAATPAAIIRIITKRRARRTGLCLECGYNLKHNQSGRCPECGTPNERSPRPVPHASSHQQEKSLSADGDSTP